MIALPTEDLAEQFPLARSGEKREAAGGPREHADTTCHFVEGVREGFSEGLWTEFNKDEKSYLHVRAGPGGPAPAGGRTPARSPLGAG